MHRILPTPLGMNGLTRAYLGVGGSLLAIGLCDCREAPADTLVQVTGGRAKVVASHDGSVQVQLVLEPHAEIVGVLTDFVSRNGWKSVHFSGIGACTDATIGYYDPATKDYAKTSFAQQMEIVSLIGDAAPGSKNAGFHAHIGLGFADGSMHGGHLFEAHASPTLELLVEGSSVPMERRHDDTFNAELLVP